MIERKNKFSTVLKNESGFIAAEFIFSFILVIGIGVVIFAMTFSLTSLEIAQYITWTSARSYAAGNMTKEDSEKFAREKYNNMTAAFPLLTGNGVSQPWYRMDSATEIGVGDVFTILQSDGSMAVKDNSVSGGEPRHPWFGVASNIDLILFKNAQIPFLGKIALDTSLYKFPVRAFLLRHPSYDECQDFFKAENRFQKGIMKLEGNWSNSDMNKVLHYVSSEDNGC